MAGRKRHGRRSATAEALAGLLIVAAAIASIAALVIHSSHQFSTTHDSVKDYLPTFVGSSGGVATSVSIRLPAEHHNVSTNQDGCFSLNSKSWLDGPRVGNSPLESTEATMDLIFSNNLPKLLQQTICHDDSRFRDWNDVSTDDESSLNLAALRLVYLAFHIHQHEPAWREARHRRQHCTDEDLQIHHHVGNMDFECPEAKFLVVPLGEAGLGAVMRLTVVNALLAGMATQRVVLFVNNANAGPPNVKKPWPHASCERHDMQCFFLAPTPCVLTEEELTNAHILERSEMRSMFRNGVISGEHAEDRVVVTKINTRPHMAPPHLRENLVTIAKKYITPNERNGALLERAVVLIHEIEPLAESRYYYFGHSSKVHHGAVFYAMRPRPEYANLLNEIVNESLPNDFDTATSLGIPIRGKYIILLAFDFSLRISSHLLCLSGSDKCLVESECLSFEQYMNVIVSVWKKHHSDSNAVANIILTTEDEHVMREMKKFDPTSIPFSHRFVTNEKDVLQGTGVANDFEKSGNVTADQVMLSSLTALKLQLSSKYSVGNCCSNFHNLLFDFLRDGCGPAQDIIAMCLQELEQAEYRVCCAWDKSDECEAKREASAENNKNETHR